MLGLDALRSAAPSRRGRLDSTESRWPLPSILCASPLLLCLLGATAHAQQKTAKLETSSSSSLPDAPSPQVDVLGPAAQTPSAVGTASVAGTILDTSGAEIPGAQVSLTHRDGIPLHTLFSAAGGDFVFTKLPAGSYLVIVNAKGFASYTTAEFTLSPDQSYMVPSIALSVASATTEVTVRPTEVIAAEQIKAEEKQRFIGVIPNFYISYVHDPAPMTIKQKFSLASHDTFDPVSLIGVGLAAGIEQANDKYPGYGYGAAGYGKRFAAQFGDGRTSDFLSHAVFPSLFHQDPRYFYQGTGTIKSRLIHAASYAIITRGDNGKPMPNYSYFLGDIGSGAISNLYYPHADRGIGLVFTNAAIGIAGKAGGTIIREFFSKRITTNVPPSGTP
nr:carboxypeptidase-like regulatory domain-containing protein [Granulicella aggregans]